MEVAQFFFHHFSPATTLPLVVVLLTIAVVRMAIKASLVLKGSRVGGPVRHPPPPGPTPLPVVGSLHLLGGHSPAYAGFTELAKTYGAVFSIRLGSVDCVVVNDVSSAREVLSEKDSFFDARPDFLRFDSLFGGSKQNSLAFCDYNQLQCKRRNMLKKFTFPHAFSFNWNRLDQICQEETAEMVHLIHEQLLQSRKSAQSRSHVVASSQCSEVIVDMKTLITKVCANIFNMYFCGIERMDFEDPELSEFCHTFDLIFWEVNNGRAVDFMPWLMPFMQKSTRNMAELSHKVRKFVEERIISSKLDRESDPCEEASDDFLDTLMKYIEESPEGDTRQIGGLDRDGALFALEDIIGGHSAVASITLRALKDLALNQERLPSSLGETSVSAQQKIRRQLLEASYDSHNSSLSEVAGAGLAEKKNHHWLMASIYETIRLTCSPIVPHRANQDATIQGFEVKKGTAVFINNHVLNMAEELWHQPEKYDPGRFLDDRDQFAKPDHFFPFSIGRRSCMGYKMVQNVSYCVLAALIKHFRFSGLEGQRAEAGAIEVEEQMPVGMLASAPQPILFRVSRLESQSEEGRFRA